MLSLSPAGPGPLRQVHGGRALPASPLGDFAWHPALLSIRLTW